LRRGDDPERKSQENRERRTNLDRESFNYSRDRYRGDIAGYSGSRERSRYETGSNCMSGVGLGPSRRDDQGSFRNEPYRRVDDRARASGHGNRERRSYVDRGGFGADRGVERTGYAGNYGDRRGDIGGFGGDLGVRDGHREFGVDRESRGGGYGGRGGGYGGRGGGYGGGGGGGYQEGMNLLIKMIIIS
jgi:hypothetical protein